MAPVILEDATDVMTVWAVISGADLRKAGRRDILALDEDSKCVVIELIAGRAQSKSVAQILAYMTAIAGEMGTNVRGMIVAGSFSEKVLLAARAVPDLDLITYSFNLTFSEAV